MYESRSNPTARRWLAVLLAMVLVLPMLCQRAWAAEEERSLIPMGNAVGIKLFADGVLVVSLSDGSDGQPSPAKSCGLKEGDLIVAINGEKIESTEHVQSLLRNCGGKRLNLSVRRSGKAMELSLQPSGSESGGYRLGAWIRDSMAGIGTLTYYDPATGDYGALGHGITDVDTAQLMPLSSGSIMETHVKAVRKGTRGEPGELRGDFSTQHDVGTLTANTERGIFGTMEETGLVPDGEAIPVAENGEVKTGAATILTTISGDAPQAYSVEITRIYHGNQPTRNLLLRVTDERLLAVTGGIVQGMSGSPILQNGKLVGAVTHVLINDPSQGYGILMENMLRAAE